MKQEKVIRINNIKLKPDHTEAELLKAVKKALRLKNNCDIKSDIIKRSIDARHKPDIMYVYSVDVKKLVINNKDMDLKAFAKKTANNNITYNEKVIYEFPYGRINNYEGAGIKEEDRPVIIGFGPAGMFAALKLSEAGLMPVVYERGDSVEERHRKVDEFWNTGKLDTQSNVQFGEGGAGTFSDGKLNTVIKDPTGRIRNVLEMFVRFGASSEILYSNKPHIGTDVLMNVVYNIRKYCESLGAQINFNHRIDDINISDKKVSSIKVYDIKNDIYFERQCRQACLSIGHSARDTFEMLEKRNINMTAKSFAVGLRLEHPQSFINYNAYGDSAYKMPAADYKVTYQTEASRGVYSFCMCPGGYVVNASSEKNMLAVNGMSYSGRNSGNANSAIIVTVTPDDYGNNGALAGMYYQRELEKLAYRYGDGNVPVQLLGDFRQDRISTGFGSVTPNIKGSYSFANLRNVLGTTISDSISEGVNGFAKHIKGFDMEDAVFSGVESRTSSPVRIIRNENCESDIKGLFPCGEGAGYAGGITSAAVDGMKVAERIASEYIKKVTI